MSKDEENSVLVALLEDAAEHIVPRLITLHRLLEDGGEWTGTDAAFCADTLEKLRFCLSGAGDDPDCERIFAQIAHQLYQVVSLAAPGRTGAA